MHHPLRRLGLLLSTALATAAAGPISVDLSSVPAAPHRRLAFGSATRPSGSTLTVDGTSLRLDGRPWLPAMGEFQYSRYPQAQWRDELLKMKAGGIDVVATYVFWIHQEEVEDRWDWTGRRDLRRFVQLAGEAGLKVVARIGPWDHGEVRNGGFPDWLLDKGYPLRSDDPGYLREAAGLYGQVARQLVGLLWKDGGPVVGVQVENEFGGPPQHLLTLKRLAITAGLDVPMYNRTGWPLNASPLLAGQLLPMFGAYAEGFWARELTTMPGSQWGAFTFQPVRNNTAIASDKFGNRRAEDEADVDRYPYLTCELGGGMMPSYHRRILAFPQDALAVALTHVGAGSNLPGYYMYHGGSNPDSATGITLNEEQATRDTNYNDLPVKSYDFQAPLGEFGQVRPHFHLLRRLHLFLHEFGPALAEMPPTIPSGGPTGKADAHTLRWAVRSDGTSGFLFVNNYQRLLPMPAKPGVQWQLRLAGGRTSTVPAEPITVPADRSFILPFNLPVGDGAHLTYATAQPVTAVDDGDTRYLVFAAIPGVPPVLAFDGDGLKVEPAAGGTVTTDADGRRVVTGLTPGTGVAATVTTAAGGRLKVVLLDDADSLRLYKLDVAGRPRLLLTSAVPLVDRSTVRLQADAPGDLSLAILPPPAGVAVDGREVPGVADGVFRRFDVSVTSAHPVATVDPVRPAGPLRHIALGMAHVAAEPTDADFEGAAVWHVTLPPPPHGQELLRIRYAGDVARVYAGPRLVTDHFYNGTPLDVGLDDLSPAEAAAGLTLKILPLQRDAPIYLLDASRPDFGGQDSVARVDGAAVLERRERRFAIR